MRSAYLLLLFQIVAHLAIFPMVALAKPQDYLISLTIYFLTGCIGMNMTYHRLLSHRSWKPPRFFEAIGATLGTLGLTGSSLAWCAVHRDHHQYADTIHDPHSPHHSTFWKVQFLSMFYRPNLRRVPDLIKSPIHRFLHKNYFFVQLFYVLLLGLVDPFLIVSAYLFPAAILWNAGSAVNSIGHLVGYKLFTCKDESRNNWLLGYLVWGEGWHNNHHRFPKKSYFGNRWYELDVTGLLIKIFQRT